MAKETLDSLEKINKVFGEVMQRASLSFYFSNNCHLICKDEYVTIITICPELWNLLHENGWMKEHDIREVDVKNEQEKELLSYEFITNEDGWVTIEDPSKLYGGEVEKVRIPEMDYSVSYTKDLFPLRLKKSEYKDMSTKLTQDKHSYILGLRKTFQEKEFSFAMIRLFRIM